MTIYSLDILLYRFGTSLLFHVQLLDLHTDFSGGRSGSLVLPSLEEFSIVCCDPHSQRSVIKSLYSHGCGLSSSHIWMWELDHKESRALKNWCFQTAVLEKMLESPLENKEIKPVNLKVNQPWIFIQRTEAGWSSAVGLVTQSWLSLCNPMDNSLPGSSIHEDSPGKNTGVGCHALLQGIFSTQGLNPGLPHCRWILHHMSRKERSG